MKRIRSTNAILGFLAALLTVASLSVVTTARDNLTDWTCYNMNCVENIKICPQGQNIQGSCMALDCVCGTIPEKQCTEILVCTFIGG